MIEIDSIVKMDWGNIRVLTDAQETALEQTADYLQSESGQAQENPHAGREYYHPEYEVKTRKSFFISIPSVLGEISPCRHRSSAVT